MKVAVLKEMVAGEKRVAAVPPTVEKMVAAGMEVFVQEGAGVASGFADADYRAAGAKAETSPAASLKAETSWSRARVLPPKSSNPLPVALPASSSCCGAGGYAE